MSSETAASSFKAWPIHASLCYAVAKRGFLIADPRLLIPDPRSPTPAIMHLPDHYLDPTTCAATALISGAAVVYAVRKLRTESPERLQMLAAVSAAIFAAQMVNFPIAAGTSGHVIGGTLAAILLGPSTGLLAITLVLAVQALVFGDGGIAALGANILNMGIIGALGGGYIYDRNRVLFSKLNDRVGIPLAAAMAASTTVLIAALACSLEMAIAGKFSLNDVLGSMLGVHSLIALSEGLLTAGVVGLIYQLSPLMIADTRANRITTGHGLPVALPADSSTPPVARDKRWTLFAVAVGIAIFLSPLASPSPDGLESVIEPLAGHVEPLSLLPIDSLLSDYEIPGIASPILATALAGLLGTLMVALLGRSLNRVQRGMAIKARVPSQP